MWLLLAAGLALAAPKAGSPAPTRLVSDLSLGASRSQVEQALTALGATEVQAAAFRSPGAFAEGLMRAPGMLALLNRAGADVPFFDHLPKAGPTFVTARMGQARGAYAFVQGKLWSMAATLPARVVAPAQDPFDPDRMAPLHRTLDQLCRGLQPAAQDEYRNTTAWRSGSCAGGQARVWYDARDVDAAVQVVVYRR